VLEVAQRDRLQSGGGALIGEQPGVVTYRHHVPSGRASNRSSSPSGRPTARRSVLCVCVIALSIASSRAGTGKSRALRAFVGWASNLPAVHVDPRLTYPQRAGLKVDVAPAQRPSFCEINESNPPRLSGRTRIRCRRSCPAAATTPQRQGWGSERSVTAMSTRPFSRRGECHHALAGRIQPLHIFDRHQHRGIGRESLNDAEEGRGGDPSIGERTIAAGRLLLWGW
jgi:hypothetical protein